MEEGKEEGREKRRKRIMFNRRIGKGPKLTSALHMYTHG